MREILYFIDRFRSARGTFLFGCCYWFAEILETRFNGRKMYHPVLNHFACEIDGLLFDVTGVINPEGFEDWYLFMGKDELETERIIRDCIRMEEVAP